MAKKSKKKHGAKKAKAESTRPDGAGAPSRKGTKRKQEQISSSVSLAQQLKKHRGVAAKTAPPLIWKDASGKQYNFLTPQEDPDAFNECLKTSFAGFYHDTQASLPSSLHREYELSFGGMDAGGLFLYDAVQPGKKRLTRTSVTRTLVGDPGSTYKYLGLRLFSHPWVDVDKDGDASVEEKSGSTLKKLGYSSQITSALLAMGNVNKDLTERSNSMLQNHVSQKVSPVGLVGSAEFNLTLVNKMESSTTKRDLKKDVAYGMGKISVGWHRDSGLKDFSTIAVYQSLKDASSHSSKSNNDLAWGVALRAMDGGAGGPISSIPPLMIPLPSGSLYYMLDDFNHNHEHAVIAGSGGIRYSSTHRVAREGAGTWQYIRDKAKGFLSDAADYDLSKGKVVGFADLSVKKTREKMLSHVRAQQNLMTEIEIEWIRQWFVQGKLHASLHPYWHKPIQKLCDSFCELEMDSSEIINLLREHGHGDSHVTEDLYDVMIEALSERSRLRSAWVTRYSDPIFDGIPANERPFQCPCLDRRESVEGQMPENLDTLVSQIRQWRSDYITAEDPEESNGTGIKGDTKKAKKSKKKSKSGLTKKESRSKASNWEKLKANLK